MKATINQPIYSTGLHWVSYISPLILIVLGLFGFPKLFTLFAEILEGRTDIISMNNVLGLILMFILFRGVYSLLLNKSTAVLLFDRSLTFTKGILGKQYVDISLSKYEGLSLSQDIMGRILNYGTLSITTGGITQKYRIKNPMELREYLNNQINIII